MCVVVLGFEPFKTDHIAHLYEAGKLLNLRDPQITRGYARLENNSRPRKDFEERPNGLAYL